MNSDDASMMTQEQPWPRVESPPDGNYHARSLATQIIRMPDGVSLGPTGRLGLWHWFWMIVTIVLASGFAAVPFFLFSQANDVARWWYLGIGVFALVPVAIAIGAAIVLPIFSVREGTRNETAFIWHAASDEFEFPGLRRSCPRRDVAALHHVSGWLLLGPDVRKEKHYFPVHQIFVTLREEPSKPRLLRTSSDGNTALLPKNLGHELEIPVHVYELGREQAARITGYATF